MVGEAQQRATTLHTVFKFVSLNMQEHDIQNVTLNTVKTTLAREYSVYM